MAVDNNTWITVFMLVVIALGGGSFLYLTDTGFTLEIGDSTKFKLKDDTLKAYEGRSLVYSDQIQPYYYNSDRRSYVKMYRQRGEKFSNLSYRNEGNVYYLKKDSYYSQGTLTRYYTITKSGIQKTAFKWNPDDPNLRTYFTWRYKDMDSIDEKIVYLDKTKKQTRATIDNGYIIDWGTEVDNLVRVERFKNGNLQLRTRTYQGVAEFDPFIFTNGRAGDAEVFADGIEITFKQEELNASNITVNVTKAWINASVWRWNGTNWTSPSAGINVWYNDSLYKWGTDILDNQTDNLIAISYNSSDAITYQRNLYKMDVAGYGIVVLNHNDLCSETENGTVTRNCSFVSINGLPGIQFNVNTTFDPTIQLINGTDFNATFTQNMGVSQDFSFLNVNDSSIIGFWNFDADGQDKRQEGQVQTSLDINAADQDQVTFNDIKQTHNLTGFSLFMWVNPDTTNVERGIVAQWELGGQTVFFLENFGNKIAVKIAINDTDAANTFAKTTTTSLVINKWFHIGFVFNGSGSGNSERMKMYVDGVEEAVTFTGTMPSQLSDGNVNFTLGHLFGAGGSFYDGQYDELVMYNESLNQSRITAIYDRGVIGLENLDSVGRFSYYKFDEFSGVTVIDDGTAGENGLANYLPITAYDFSGNGNDGIYIGDANNNIIFKGPALLLDGTDKITIQNSDSLNDFTNQMTIAMWVKPGSNQTVTSNTLIARAISDWQLSYLAPNPINGVGAGKVTSRINATSLSLRSDIILPREVFTHVVLTYNGTDMEMFFDNVSVGTKAETNDVARGSTVVTIGSSQASTNFNGSLDDVLLMNRGLSRAEVGDLFKNQSPNYFSTGNQTFLAVDFNNSACGGGGCDAIVLNNSLIVEEPSSTDVQLQVDFWRGKTTDGYNTFKDIFNGLISHWTGDGTADDLLGLNDGTFVADANASVDGVYSTAFGFDGVGDKITIPNSDSLNNFTNQMTISMWVNPGSNQTVAGLGSRLIVKGTNTWQIIYFAPDPINGAFAGKVSAKINGSFAAVTSNVILDRGVFTHVVLTYNGTDKELFFNTVSVGINSETADVGRDSNVVTIGSSTATKNFNGSIDDVMLWNRGLSSDEVSDLFTQRTSNSLLGYWTGDGSATDELGLNDGTFQGDANADVVGIYDNAFEFDGAGDLVTIDHNPLIRNLTEFSAFLWVNSDTTISERTFAASWLQAVNSSWDMGMNNDQFEVLIAASPTDPGVNFVRTQTGKLVAGKFIHYGFVFNGSGSTNEERLRLYINGVEDTDLNFIGTIPSKLTDAVTNLTFGRLQIGTGTFFDGTLDDIMMWRRALSSDDVKDVYTRGLADWQTGNTAQGNKNNIYQLTTNTEKILPIILMTSASAETPFYKSSSLGSGFIFSVANTTTVPLADAFNLFFTLEAINPQLFIYSLGFELNTTNFTGSSQSPAGAINPTGLSTPVVGSYPVSPIGVIYDDYYTQITKAEMGNINTLPDIVNRSFSIMFRLAGGVGSDETEIPINITRAILNLGLDAKLDNTSLLLTQGTFNGGTTNSNVPFSVE